jgi:hypothetical protein
VARENRSQARRGAIGPTDLSVTPSGQPSLLLESSPNGSEEVKSEGHWACNGHLIHVKPGFHRTSYEKPGLHLIWMRDRVKLTETDP